jgi:hypothetical protein
MQQGAKSCNKLRLLYSLISPGLANDVLPDANAEKRGNIGNMSPPHFVERSQQLL